MGVECCHVIRKSKAVETKRQSLLFVVLFAQIVKINSIVSPFGIGIGR